MRPRLVVLLAGAAACLAQAASEAQRADDQSARERNDELTVATAVAFLAFFGGLLVLAALVTGGIAAKERVTAWLRRRHGQET